MEIKVYNTLPPQGRRIREEVFVREQGFQEEFDSIDGFATHILVLSEGSPAGICRVFWDEGRQQFLLGRVAVLRPFRMKGIGAALVILNAAVGRVAQGCIKAGDPALGVQM